MSEDRFQAGCHSGQLSQDRCKGIVGLLGELIVLCLGREKRRTRFLLQLGEVRGSASLGIHQRLDELFLSAHACHVFHTGNLELLDLDL